MQVNMLFHERALHEIRLDETFPHGGMGHCSKRIEKYTTLLLEYHECVKMIKMNIWMIIFLYVLIAECSLIHTVHAVFSFSN